MSFAGDIGRDPEPSWVGRKTLQRIFARNTAVELVDVFYSGLDPATPLQFHPDDYKMKTRCLLNPSASIKAISLSWNINEAGFLEPHLPPHLHLLSYIECAGRNTYQVITPLNLLEAAEERLHDSLCP